MQTIIDTGRAGAVTLPPSVGLTTDINDVSFCDVVVISVGSQGLSSLMAELSPLGLENKIFVLCMKGIEISTGKRLSEIVREAVPPSSSVAVWLGPGHVEEFVAGRPNCMVIDVDNDGVKRLLVDRFSSELIRFYYGTDLIGNEVGAAAKNVIGIAAGVLDGLDRSSLKGALMARAPREISRLIVAMGGSELSAYGLCHLGDYEATVFSPHSHNRAYGESLISGVRVSGLCEGYYTAKALVLLADRLGVDLPICRAVYNVIYNGADPLSEIGALFSRSLKNEF
jgi:glycerol-3-phosphate dehydrogenase (NAD(P)+)